MFCIKSDVITLGSIEMYGFVTIWTSMYDGPYWVIFTHDGSHDMRHTSFPQVDGGQRDPKVLGVTTTLYSCTTTIVFSASFSVPQQT